MEIVAKHSLLKIPGDSTLLPIFSLSPVFLHFFVRSKKKLDNLIHYKMNDNMKEKNTNISKKYPCMYEKAGKDYQKIREKMEIEEDAAKII